MRNIECLSIITLVLMATSAAAASVQPPPKEVEESVEDLNISSRKLLEYGEKRDRSKLKELKRIRALKGMKHKVDTEHAQMALAKLGEKKEMDEILAETRSTNNYERNRGIRKLEYVRNEESIARLISLLDAREIKVDVYKDKDGKVQQGDVIFAPPALDALKALKKIFPDGPKFALKHPTNDDIAPWKAWLKSNRKK